MRRPLWLGALLIPHQGYKLGWRSNSHARFDHSCIWNVCNDVTTNQGHIHQPEGLPRKSAWSPLYIGPFFEQLPFSKLSVQVLKTQYLASGESWLNSEVMVNSGHFAKPSLFKLWKPHFLISRRPESQRLDIFCHHGHAKRWMWQCGVGMSWAREC